MISGRVAVGSTFILLALLVFVIIPACSLLIHPALNLMSLSVNVGAVPLSNLLFLLGKEDMYAYACAERQAWLTLWSEVLK